MWVSSLRAQMVIKQFAFISGTKIRVQVHQIFIDFNDTCGLVMREEEEKT
jgi:hypothetical protein